MPLASGDRLGPYEIAEMIGKGGMGEVYRAHDPRLRRDVAIKVSAEQFSERFEREARAVAALNHPNICTLFDVGPNYLVMELVEGPTLAERIKEGALPLEEALPIARQITAALDAAHEKGITHRDLKPGNIKIKPGGLVKLLDFGLAKVAPERGPLGEDSATLSMTNVSEAGVVLGTAAYMSPEQARGKTNLDKRADIWAFGVVLHEMLTGEKLFRREDLTGTLAAVIKDYPDLTRAPQELRHLISRCLEKDPATRLRDIADVWDLVGQAISSPVSSAPPSKLPWIAAAVLGVAAIAFALLWRTTPPQIFSANEFLLYQPPNTTFSGVFAALGVSPDGRYIVFAATVPGGTDAPLWLRPLDSLEARPIPGTEGGNFPFWSPDSKSIVFGSGSDRKLKRIEIAGGAPLVLTDNQAGPISPVGAWSQDGVILYGTVDGLQRISPSGGTPTLITKVNPAAKETGHGFPQFLPDGKRFLYFVASGDPQVQGVYAASLDQPEQRTLVLRTGVKAIYAPPRGGTPGYLLWMQDHTLLAQRFDPGSLRLEGDPVSVAQDVAIHPSISIRATYWADGGVLAYRTAPPEQRPVIWMSAEGEVLGDAMPADQVDSLKLSPDGRKLAMTRRVAGGTPDIWVRDLESGSMTRLTFDPAEDAAPVWSPDSRHVVYTSDRDGASQIYRKDASGAGSEEPLTSGPNAKAPVDWSRDGKYLLYSERRREGDQDLWVLPLEGPSEPIPIAQSSAIEAHGEISPDGRWIVYGSSEFRRTEVYVRPAPWVPGATDGRWQVSDQGGAEPRWRADGGEIYYRTGFDFMAAAVRKSAAGFQTDKPRKLLTATTLTALRVFDVTPDGRKFVFIMQPPATVNAGPLTVVTNWQAKLR